MWSKVNLSWQQLFWIAHKLNFIQASTESNNVAEIIDSLSYRGKSTTIVPIWKSIGFIGVLILYLETGVCCMFPIASYSSAWSSIAYLLFNVLSRIYVFLLKLLLNGHRPDNSKDEIRTQLFLFYFVSYEVIIIAPSFRKI